MEKVLQLGNIEATGNHIGGIVGLIRDSSVVTLSSISQHGNVIGSGDDTTDTGGLIGQVRESSSINIQNALNTGNVSNTNNRESGGLIGRVGDGGDFGKVVITNAYNAGTVSSNGGNVGSLIGKIENADSVVTFTAVFWNTDIGSVSNSIGDTTTEAVTSGSITGVTADAMIDIDTFNTGGADWDINSYPDLEGIWTIGGADDQDTYPWLSWTEAPNESVEVDLTAILIASGYIPIASPEDFENMDSSTARNWAVGTIYEKQNTIGGLDKKFILVNDINISTGSIRTEALFTNGDFEGVLDGNNNSVTDLIITFPSDKSEVYGFFRTISENATIKNITFSNFVITGSSASGGTTHGLIARTSIGFGTRTLENISVINSVFDVDTSTSSNVYRFGLIGYHSDGKLNIDSLLIDDFLFTNTRTTGESFNHIGLVVGYIENSEKIDFSNLTVSGVIELSDGNSKKSYYGGLIGRTVDSFDLTITNIDVTISITGSGSIAGGLIGGGLAQGSSLVNLIISNASISTNIYFGSGPGYPKIGGLIGEGWYNTTLQSIDFNGSIFAINLGDDEAIGGLIGSQHSDKLITVNNVTVSAFIDTNGESSYSGYGGLVGELDDTSSISGNGFRFFGTINSFGTQKGHVIGNRDPNTVINLYDIKVGTTNPMNLIGPNTRSGLTLSPDGFKIMINDGYIETP